MRHLLTVIVGTILSIVLFMTVDWRDIDFSFSTPSQAAETNMEPSADYVYGDFDNEIWIDTLMCAYGHSFGNMGDITTWMGWCYDSIPVGDDIMMSFDSIGPSSFKLSLVTQNLVVDLADPKALEKIKNFLSPLKGFTRFQKNYEEVLDSMDVDGYHLKCTGYYSFTADVADSGTKNASQINKFVCDLTGISPTETAKVPALSALYAGFKPGKNYRPVYTGSVDDMKGLSDFLANTAFEEWRRNEDTNSPSNARTMEVRVRISNPRYVTCSVYDYDRVGIGHGMYAQTFSTLDLMTGEVLTNSDIFKPNTLDKVKKALFETMFADKHYQKWNPRLESPDDIEWRIEGWQSPNPILEGKEWEEPRRESPFELPDGALTETGIVFSFQPYEIDCWAAGAYHFVVPYAKMMPYLTPEAKKLIK